MAAFIGSVVLNVSDSRRAAEFWSKALGYVPQPNNPEFLVPPEWRPPSNSRLQHGDGTHLHLDQGDKTHLDLWLDRDSDLQAEVERLISLGAKRVQRVNHLTERERHVLSAMARGRDQQRDRAGG